jgi:D-amino-acid dehydrogenase
VTTTNDSVEIAIIGAGIVGGAIAFALTQAGRQVTLIDRKGLAQEASFGNAGAFAFSDILPLASPGILQKAPRWLIDPLGPLSLPPAYALAAGPWLWRFFRASTPARFRKSLEAQAALMALARRETLPFLERAGLAEEIVSHGALTLYESEKSFEAARAEWAHRDPYGIRYAHLDRAGIEARQPGLSPRFRHATFIEDWHNVRDPHALAKSLSEAAIARGATLTIAPVTALEDTGDGVTITLGNGSKLQARTVILAAGAWSHRLAATIGDRVPLETERGYNTTLPRDAFDLNCQLIFSEHGFVVSPLGVGIRVGGAVELAGLARKPDYRRSRVMLDKTKAFLPALKTDGGTQWMGFRPSLPDSLPVIGRSSNAKNVIHAFGHGHLGLTQSAATARLVADLVANANPAIDLAPFSPARF